MKCPICSSDQFQGHIDNQWVSRALDDLWTATSGLGMCLRNEKLDPSGDFHWIASILERLRAELLAGKSTADMQRERANELRGAGNG